MIDEPFLEEGKVFSVVGADGFMIGGNWLDIHPLTCDKMINDISGFFYGNGTLIELEVWHLTFLP